MSTDNKQSEVSNGEVIDSMSLEDILNHKDFYQLNVFKGFLDSPDYWEITFESGDRLKNNNYLTMFNREVPFKKYKFYKLKS